MHTQLVFKYYLESWEANTGRITEGMKQQYRPLYVINMTSRTTLNIIRLHNMSTIYSVYCSATWHSIWQQTINYMYLISLSNMSHDSHPYLWHIWQWPHPPASVAPSPVDLYQSPSKSRESISHSSPPQPPSADDWFCRDLWYSPA